MAFFGGEKSWIRMRPGLDQSLGWVLSGSRVSGMRWPVEEITERRAVRRLKASGLGVAREVWTRRPWARVRVESK